MRNTQEGLGPFQDSYQRMIGDGIWCPALEVTPFRTLCFLLALAGTFWSGGRFVMSADHPNVVVILADDQGWGDLSANGNQNLSTPHVDSLARDGASFDRFFVCPVCSPTRAEFLTGRYHPRSGVYSTSTGGERINLREKTIAESFRAAGYATAAFGKWHNGMQPPYHPLARGFDEFYGFCSGHWGHYFSPMLEHNGMIVQGEGFVIDDFTNRAMQFIEQHAEQPFFVYLPYNTPHSPMQVPERWWSKFRDKTLSMRHRDPGRENVPHTRAALAMCENIDWNVGRLLKKLEELQLADETIVLYFCDNGPNGFRWNGGMKGRKGSTDEGGVRSPLFIRWPSKIPAGKKIPQIAGAIDLLPTLADLCGVKVITTQPLDGVSLRPLLLEDHPDWSDRMIFSYWGRRLSVRMQRYRLDHQGRLFDLEQDPRQDQNVAAQHPELTRRLKAAQQQWKETVVGPKFGQDDRPFPIGHPDFSFTQMPARDAVPHGGIKRSNRHPNCTYFTHWTTTDDMITWDVEVLTSGQYKVEAYYTCPAEDLGSQIELVCGKSRLVAKVAKAHESPLIGRQQDRVERAESYVKDFVPMSLGVISLEQGRQTLSLRAIDIPGSQVMDFRLLMFHRIP